MPSIVKIVSIRKRAGKYHADDHADIGGDRDQGIPQGVAQNCLAVRQALGKRRAHIVLVELFHHGIFHQERDGGETADRVAQNRQEHMGDIIADLAEKGKLFEIIGHKAADGEYIKEAAASEKDDQNNSQNKRRDGIAYKNKNTRNLIEDQPMRKGFFHTERDADQVCEKQACDAESERNGKTAENDVRNRLFIGVGSAEVEPDKLSQPEKIADQDGFIKTIVFFYILYFFLRHILLDGACAGRCPALALREAPHFLDRLFDRPAGYGLHDQKARYCYAEHCRDDEQKPF